jgi:hypothetical protein
MADADEVCGPIDFLMLSFDEESNDGSAGAALLDLVDRGVIALYDIRLIRKASDGLVTGVDLDRLPNTQTDGFARFAGARSGLLTDDDIADAATAMELGTSAMLLVYENTWSRPFIAAAATADAHVLATARIPAEKVIEVLDELDAATS